MRGQIVLVISSNLMNEKKKKEKNSNNYEFTLIHLVQMVISMIFRSLQCSWKSVDALWREIAEFHSIWAFKNLFQSSKTFISVWVIFFFSGVKTLNNFGYNYVSRL